MTTTTSPVSDSEPLILTHSCESRDEFARHVTIEITSAPIGLVQAVYRRARQYGFETVSDYLSDLLCSELTSDLHFGEELRF